jgi:cell division protease FtsH
VGLDVVDQPKPIEDDEGTPEPSKKPPRSKRWRKFIAPILYGVFMLASLWWLQRTDKGPEEVPYSELTTKLGNGDLSAIVVQDTAIVGYKPDSDPKKDPGDFVAARPPETDDAELLALARKHEVKIIGDPAAEGWWVTLLWWVLPLVLIVGPWLLLTRAMGKRGPLSFGRGRAKIYDAAEGTQVTFDDVAGVDEAKAELQELIRFLREPKRFEAIGAKVPKGVLLVGAPGTGKTLLAKAVAGEAGVPFFSMSGSGFIEMFVGVGAARVRELFEQAKARAPCIIFIDEIDAIGRTRSGVAAMGTHEEREQTLNQLLTEMDGFDTSAGVVIMAATNRPEILDRALTRAGRFDRKVIVDAPARPGRKAILEVHSRNVKLADDVDLDLVAKRTPGMVGADLARIVNEAALAATRRNAERVEQVDFEEAIDRIQLGLARRGRAMNEAERRRVAYHEAGHALVALALEHADPVHRVTIIPRTIGALGATLQLPTEDRYLMTRAELRDRICVMFGGRVAEEVALEDISTGAQNDLERASETARQMVCRFGMNDQFGPQTFGQPAGLQFLDTPAVFGDRRNFSESRAAEIDRAIDEIITREYERARGILVDQRDTLERVAQALLERETLEGEDLQRLCEASSKARDAEHGAAQLTS